MVEMGDYNRPNYQIRISRYISDTRAPLKVQERRLFFKNLR